MTEKQIRYALYANHGWKEKKFDEFFAGYQGEYTDEDYNRAVAQYGRMNIMLTRGNITHAELAEDDMVHSYDNNFDEWR